MDERQLVHDYFECANTEQWERMLTDMRAAGAADFATLSVGIETLRRLAV